MVSSSDLRWNTKNKMRIIDKSKVINNNVIVNDLHSGEEVETGIYFLKDVTLTALWSTIVNYADIECMIE